MKVEVVCDSLSAAEGGSATYSDDVIGAIITNSARSNHQVYVLSWSALPKEQQLRQPGSFRWVHLRRSFTQRARGKPVYLLQRLASRWRKAPPPPSPYHSFIAETREKLGIEFALVINPFTPIRDIPQPYIATVWDLEHRIKPIFPEVSDGGEFEQRESHFRKYLGKAAMIIVGTQEGKRQIEKFYSIPGERIAVIALPTPSFALESRFNDAVRPRALPEGIEGNFVFYPAQFWPHKNHVTLLEAVAILKEEAGIRVSLVFSGSDKGNRLFVEATALNLQIRDQVHFAGFVAREELIWLYRNSLALAFVSFFGPDNLPPLEAFALGCPVIAARLPGVEEQLGDAALLVDPSDEHQLAEAIRLLTSDSALRQTLIEKGVERASFNTPRHYAEEVFALLDEMQKLRRCWNRYNRPASQRLAC